MTLIRHGESEANIKNIWGGDYPLTEKGRQQALQIQKKETPLVIASELIRAQETARLVYPNAVIVTDGAFNELGYGDLEDEPMDFFGDAFDKYIRYPQLFHKYFNGDDIEARASFALERLNKYPRETVIFTHSGLIQAMKSLIYFHTVRYMHAVPMLKNCEGWEL